MEPFFFHAEHGVVYVVLQLLNLINLISDAFIYTCIDISVLYIHKCGYIFACIIFFRNTVYLYNIKRCKVT